MKRLKTLSILLCLLAFCLMMSCDKEEPKIDPRDQYVGIYDVVESWVEDNVSYELEYVLTVEKSSSKEEFMFFFNIGNFGSNIDAEVLIEESGFSIPQQNLSNGYGILGSGELVDDELTFNYQNVIEGYVYSVSAVGTKK